MPPSCAGRQRGVADAQDARLQHQPDRLAHGHEVALHVGMRDRQRAAARELALEQRHHRPGAAQHVAEADGDAAHALAARLRARRYPAPGSTFPPAAWRRPSRVVGFTALSVEISTIASAPTARAASATWRVPAALVSSPSSGLASTIGTCFSAAAWNTSSGRSVLEHGADARLVADVGDQRMAAAPADGSRPVPGRSATARIRRCPAGSECRGRRRRPGGRVRCRWCRRRR